MSDYFEVVFSMFLSDATPSVVLDELRWHLGLRDAFVGDRELTFGEDENWRVLEPQAGSRLPGGESGALVRQSLYTRPDGVDHCAWGVFSRRLWLDDEWANYWWIVATWLARYADRDGFAGFFRGESVERVTLFTISDGKPCLQEPGESPTPLQ